MRGKQTTDGDTARLTEMAEVLEFRIAGLQSDDADDQAFDRQADLTEVSGGPTYPADHGGRNFPAEAVHKRAKEAADNLIHTLSAAQCRT
ncbi:MAG: hypothetical protein ACLVJ6_09290 [Merdibacter sp.]